MLVRYCLLMLRQFTCFFYLFFFFFSVGSVAFLFDQKKNTRRQGQDVKITYYFYFLREILQLNPIRME